MREDEGIGDPGLTVEQGYTGSTVVAGPPTTPQVAGEPGSGRNRTTGGDGKPTAVSAHKLDLSEVCQQWFQVLSEDRDKAFGRSDEASSGENGFVSHQRCRRGNGAARGLLSHTATADKAPKSTSSGITV